MGVENGYCMSVLKESSRSLLPHGQVVECFYLEAREIRKVAHISGIGKRVVSAHLIINSLLVCLYRRTFFNQKEALSCEKYTSLIVGSSPNQSHSRLHRSVYLVVQ